MSEDRTYNGWTNYETWAVALWIDNERGNYDYWREEAREHRKAAPTCSQVINGIWTAEQAAKFNLADQLKEEIRDNAPDTEASMYTDLLRGALDEVNWNEIAGNWLSDLEDIEEEEEPEEVEEDAEEKPEKAEDGPVIFNYTRAQAIEQGSLIDVSKDALACGIILPIAVTKAVWKKCIALLGEEVSSKERNRIRYVLGDLFLVLPGWRETPQPKCFFSTTLPDDQKGFFVIRLKACCLTDDNGEPVLTVMLPEEE